MISNSDGDVIQAMTSFQRFFMIGGKQNVFLFAGTDPIADTTADSKDFDIVGLFPQGTVSPESLVSLGNDAAFVTPDGVQTVAMIDDASTLERANISEALRVTLRRAYPEHGRRSDPDCSLPSPVVDDR